MGDIAKLERFDSIEEIDGAHWSALVNGHDMAYSLNYMRYLESREPGSRPVLLLGDLAACCLSELHERTPIVGKPANLLTHRQYLRITPETEPADAEELRSVLARHVRGALPYDLDSLLMRAWRAFMEHVGVSLVVRNLWDSRILLARRLDPPVRRYALAHMVNAVKEEAVRRGYRSVAFVYVPDEADLLQRALTAAGFSRALIGGPAAIDLSGCAGFDDYLARFSRNGRQGIRGEMRQFVRASLEVARIDYEAAIPRIANLHHNTNRKHGDKSSFQDVREVHATLHETLREQLVACGVTHDEQLVASTVMLRGEDELRVLLYGADYEATAQLPGGYASALVYWPVRYALGNGLKLVNVGPESYDAKLLRGARVYPRYAFVWAATPAGKAFLADWMRLSDNLSTRFFEGLGRKYHKRYRVVQDMQR